MSPTPPAPARREDKPSAVDAAATDTAAPPRLRLIVFSDDWGRHPSSCQHLVSKLLSSGSPRPEVLWVNTIGTRMPRPSMEDLKKVLRKLKQWTSPPQADARLPEGLTVVTPRMYPGFRAGWQRRLNAKLISTAVNKTLGPRQPGEQRVAITTIPLTADLIKTPGTPPRDAKHTLDVDRWVYYCVDDFSVWPGVDANVMQTMEADQVRRIDAALAVSDTLMDRLTKMGPIGRDAATSASDGDASAKRLTLLTHGIDLEHWQSDDVSDGLANAPAGFVDGETPRIVFWGLVDQRLDMAFCEAISNWLASRGKGSFLVIGPQQSPDARLASLPRVTLPGPADYAALPAIAQACDVLVMPYADLPVTRAMQPLKFKEYLATGKPVVGRSLPSNEPWADCADLAATPDAFVQAIEDRLEHGISDAQLAARRRLVDESWARKAEVFEAVLRCRSAP